MPERRYQERDCRFEDWRRNNVEKGGIKIDMPIYSSDLDSVEYVFRNRSAIPVGLIERALTGEV